MLTNYSATKNIRAFSHAVNTLRDFFLQKRFLEVHTQDRLSILAACEDPSTIALFEYMGLAWPLPQTGQMWLEYELLKNPEIPGVFCISTSFRQEPNPIPGRHELIFPMFEFEAKGTLEDLKNIELDLCAHLALGPRSSFRILAYDEAARYYKADVLTGSHEARMERDFGPVVLLERFPEHTSPFWNMKREGGHAQKIDVIISGMETIGSAERSTSAPEMRKKFYTISNGAYAEKLFSTFGRKRVEDELEGFLSLNFFPRFGGGIGMTRLIRALVEKNIV